MSDQQNTKFKEADKDTKTQENTVAFTDLKDQHAKPNTNNNKVKATQLKDYKPANFLIDSVNLEIDLNEDITTVTSSLNIKRNNQVDNSDSPLILSGQELNLISISLNGEKLSENKYKVSTEILTIPSVPNEFELKIINTIKPQDNTNYIGLYKSSNMYCTQCESEGFRRINYYMDRPDVMAKFTTTIKANKSKYPILLANGNLVAKGSLDNQRHFATFEDPFKKPCYLFALVAGDLIGVFDSYLTGSGKLVTLQLYTEHKNLDKTAHAVGALKRAMRWDEKAYGREYDLDNYIIVAVDDFNFGAMENKGLNIFNSKYVFANPQTATDEDYKNIDVVVGHEYFHNWSGNRVTLRDWFQLSLKEGFTVFREQQFTKSLIGSDSVRIEEARYFRSVQFAEDGGSMAHPVQPKAYLEINNFYTVTIYDKGAEVIRMLHTILGEDTFRKGADLYFKKYDGCAVTIEELVKSMEEVSNRDLSQFRLWYSQAGTPEIEVNEEYNTETKSYTLSLRQTCPVTPDFTSQKQPMHIPVGVGLIDNQGNDIPLYLQNDTNQDKAKGFETTKVLALTDKEQNFVFTNVPTRPVLSILRGFSAPVKIKQQVADKDLAFRLINDSDPFNRWDAGQHLMKNFIRNCIKKYNNNDQLIMEGALACAFKKVLMDDSIEPMVKADIIAGVSIKELINDMETADIDAISAARNFMIYELAKENKQQLLEIYYSNQIEEIYTYNCKDMGKRKLKNIALYYLMQLEESDIINLCLNQFNKTDNMTDAIAALDNLANYNGRERESALGQFYRKWQHEPLVINKWFGVQARALLPNTLGNVKRLVRHQAFDIKNPNKVYSLIGGFAAGNPVCFHEKSGEAYKFLADIVLQLDLINSQVAARIINPLTEWHRFDADRQAMMKKELERVNREPTLSKGVMEVVTKSLNFKK